MTERAEMTWDQQFEAIEKRLDSVEARLSRIDERLKDGDRDISLAIEYSRINALNNGLRKEVEHLEKEYHERTKQRASNHVQDEADRERDTTPPRREPK